MTRAKLYVPVEQHYDGALDDEYDREEEDEEEEDARRRPNPGHADHAWNLSLTSFTTRVPTHT